MLTVRSIVGAPVSLDGEGHSPTSPRQPAGRPLRARARGGKSGLHGSTVPDNVRRGKPQGKCHRKQTAPQRSSDLGVRVKGCGKSAPRTQQCGRHGKPHREQDRIGTTGVRARPVSRLVVRVGCSRRSAMAVPEEWSPRPRSRNSGPYRTRLTGRLTPSFHSLSTGRYSPESGANRWSAYGSLTLSDSHGDHMPRSCRQPPSSVDAHNIPCYPKSSRRRCLPKGAASAQACCRPVPREEASTPAAGSGAPVELRRGADNQERASCGP